MNRKEANLAILELLKERILENKDERFCQMLVNLNINPEEMYGIEPVAILGHLKTIMNKDEKVIKE